MNVRFCREVQNPGDWAFFRNEFENGRRYIKLFIPVDPITDLPSWYFSDPRLVLLPVEGEGGWKWNGDELAPFLEPSIEVQITVGHTADDPPKPIMRSVIHGHLEHGKWRNA